MISSEIVDLTPHNKNDLRSSCMMWLLIVALATSQAESGLKCRQG